MFLSNCQPTGNSILRGFIYCNTKREIKTFFFIYFPVMDSKFPVLRSDKEKAISFFKTSFLIAFKHRPPPFAGRAETLVLDIMCMNNYPDAGFFPNGKCQPGKIRVFANDGIKSFFFSEVDQFGYQASVNIT